MAAQPAMQIAQNGFAHHDAEGKAFFMEEFFEKVYRPLRLRDGSVNTFRLYRQVIHRFSEYLQRPATLDDLNDLAVAGFLLHRQDQGRAAWTIARERSMLVALWNLAARRGMVATFPEVTPCKTPLRVPKAWTITQVKTLFAAAVNKSGWVGPVRSNVWWPALLAVLWETGERISAVMAAKRVDFQEPWLTIQPEDRKGGLAARTYKLSPATCHRLKLASDHREPQLFYWPRCHATLWSAWSRLVQAAGLPTGRGTGFHMIRRSAASHLAAQGGDATKFLGHRSPELAGRWYVDPTIAEAGRPQPVDLLPRID